MFSLLRSWLLGILRVPPEPQAPVGDPASTRVFRASPKFYFLRLLGWGLGQLFALGGLIVGVLILLAVEQKAAELRTRAATGPAPQVQAGTSVSENDPKTGKPVKAKRPHAKLVDDLAGVLAKVPPGLFFLVWLLKLLGVVAYLTQVIVTFVALRLDYEMRWYVVTDRSLRIRTGLWAVQELTMSFANLQQVVLSQGPVQRLLGIADVRVQSAGGGGVSEHGHHPQGGSLHAGYFHGVDNAPEVRDLILARLRHFRESGLGDPEEANHPVAAQESDAVLAARELLAETRQLHRALVRQ
jgi:hypothetical protein